MLSREELEKICKEYCREIWNMDIVCPITIDGRIKNSLAYFQHYVGRKKSPVAIKFSKRLVENYSNETIKDVILHELCHYVLYMQGKKYKDGDTDFETELRKIGASSTNTIPIAGTIYVLYCSCCNKFLDATDNKKKADRWIAGYKSRCCSSKLIIKEKSVNDTYNKEKNKNKCSIKTRTIEDILKK